MMLALAERHSPPKASAPKLHDSGVLNGLFPSSLPLFHPNFLLSDWKRRIEDGEVLGLLEVFEEYPQVLFMMCKYG